MNVFVYVVDVIMSGDPKQNKKIGGKYVGMRLFLGFELYTDRKCFSTLPSAWFLTIDTYMPAEFFYFLKIRCIM